MAKECIGCGTPDSPWKLKGTESYICDQCKPHAVKVLENPKTPRSKEGAVSLKLLKALMQFSNRMKAKKTEIASRPPPISTAAPNPASVEMNEGKYDHHRQFPPEALRSMPRPKTVILPHTSYPRYGKYSVPGAKAIVGKLKSKYIQKYGEAGKRVKKLQWATQSILTPKSAGINPEPEANPDIPPTVIYIANPKTVKKHGESSTFFANPKVGSLMVTKAGMDLKSKSGKYDGYARYENGEIYIDIYDSSEKDLDKAHVTAMNFPNTPAGKQEIKEFLREYDIDPDAQKNPEGEHSDGPEHNLFGFNMQGYEGYQCSLKGCNEMSLHSGHGYKSCIKHKEVVEGLIASKQFDKLKPMRDMAGKKVPSTQNPRRPHPYCCSNCGYAYSKKSFEKHNGVCPECGGELGECHHPLSVHIDENPKGRTISEARKFTQAHNLKTLKEVYDFYSDGRSHGNEYIEAAAVEIWPNWEDRASAMDFANIGSFMEAVESRAKAMEHENPSGWKLVRMDVDVGGGHTNDYYINPKQGKIKIINTDKDGQSHKVIEELEDYIDEDNRDSADPVILAEYLKEEKEHPEIDSSEIWKIVVDHLSEKAGKNPIYEENPDGMFALLSEEEAEANPSIAACRRLADKARAAGHRVSLKQVGKGDNFELLIDGKPSKSVKGLLEVKAKVAERKAKAPRAPRAAPPAPAQVAAPPPVPHPAPPPPAPEAKPAPSKVTTRVGIARRVREFMPKSQIAVLGDLLRGEESEYFYELLTGLINLWDTMPKTYESEGSTLELMDKMVYLHYFTSGSDWYIAEKDKEPEQQQAFGYAILNQDLQNAEFGYISIEELKGIRSMELDFHFKPQTIGQALAGKYPETLKEAPPVETVPIKAEAPEQPPLAPPPAVETPPKPPQKPVEAPPAPVSPPPPIVPPQAKPSAEELAEVMARKLKEILGSAQQNPLPRYVSAPMDIVEGR